MDPRTHFTSMKETNHPGTFRDFDPAPPCCYNCGYTLDAATQIHGDRTPPAEGDISICIKCASIGIFADDRLLREPTCAEMDELQKSEEWPKVVRAQELIRETQRIIRKDHRK